MKLFVTVAESTAADALAAIQRITLDHDGIEIRAEQFGAAGLTRFREATGKLLMLTYRGCGPVSDAQIRAGVDAGFDLIDVEWTPDFDVVTLAPWRDRIVLSHHDYEGMQDLRAIVDSMKASGARHAKLAATPANLAENLELLALSGDGVSVIGMGERGLYTRALAPFRGSELTFVSPEGLAAAPGQLSLERALAIFGTDRASLSAADVFAIAGNPAGHSLSPSIHNALFRQKRAPAAYTFASAAAFQEVAAFLECGELRGISVTAPFKEDAMVWARSRGIAIGENAVRCGAVNTIVMGDEPLADNTDVDGFESLLRNVPARDRMAVAIVGAGGTARAAMLAAQRLGLPAIVYNRTPGRGEMLARDFGCRSAPIADLSAVDAPLVIDTTPSADFEIDFRPGQTYIRAAYGVASPVEARARATGASVVDGMALLHAQAIRQNELFIQAMK